VLDLYDYEPRPIGAFVFSLIGSILILIDGAILVFAGGLASNVGAAAVGGLLAGLGYLGVFLGLLIGILSFFLFLVPESHLGIGIAILVLSILSLFGGGGFILGVILGIIGGILAIMFDYEPESIPLLDPELQPATAGSCPNCGTLILEGEMACTYCHRPVRRSVATTSGIPSSSTGVAPQSRGPASGAGAHAAPTAPPDERPNIGCTQCGEIHPVAGATRCRRCGAPLIARGVLAGAR
jgi:hypothetical protein